MVTTMWRRGVSILLALLVPTSDARTGAKHYGSYQAWETDEECARGFELNAQAKMWTMVAPQGNYSLCLRPEQFIDKQVPVQGRWAECEVLHKLSEPGSNFVDVGANVGACSMWMLGAGHFVTSFEPVDATYAALAAAGARTLRQAGRDAVGSLRAINAAVSDAPGNATINMEPSNLGNSAMPSERGGKLPLLVRGQKYITQTIKVTTLDEQVKWDVDVMKIDAEGYEINALRGARQHVLRRTNKITFEWNPVRMAYRGQRPAELLELLDEYGFRVFPGTKGKYSQHPLDPQLFGTLDKRPDLQGKDFVAIKRGIVPYWMKVGYGSETRVTSKASSKSSNGKKASAIGLLPSSKASAASKAKAAKWLQG